jgi:S1-C subfamily serine protease
MSTFDDLVSRIESACELFDRNAASSASHAFAAEIVAAARVYEAAPTVRAMKSLRRNRYFDAVLGVAEAVLQTGQRADAVRLAYAQALIDTGRLVAALSFLQEILPLTTRGSHGESEVRGLIGRVHKQLFVGGAGEHERREDHLLRAFHAYHDAYQEAPERYWHGINAVALLERAKKERIPLPRVEPFADRIFQQTVRLAESSPDDPWPMATSAEAALALGDHDEAIRRYAEFATSPAIGAFEIFSALRQLIEVWELSVDRDPGATLIPMLRGALLERSGGAASFADGAALRNDLERVRAGNEKTFGATMFKTLKWYRSGLERCNAICRINDQHASGIGTGFIVRGGDFHESLGDERLVLTNAHVLSDTYSGALGAGDAIATFEALGDGEHYTLDHIVWSSSELDATLARASKPLPTCATYDIGKSMPVNDQKQRVYVIGHPNGAGLTLSLNDNVMLDYDDRVAHYRAPTEGGSSGSPVFNADWKLIALHHKGDFDMRRLNGQPGSYPANEGVRIHRIIEASRAATPARV